MIDSPRHRRIALAWAAGAAAAFLALAIAAAVDAAWLRELDSAIGDGPQRWTRDHAWLRELCTAIGHAADTPAMTAATVLAGAALFARNLRRAAIWTVGTMLAVSLATTVIKLLVDRERPTWDDPIQILDKSAFPSGHASGIAAAAGIAITLSVMLVRRRSLRRLASGGALAVAAVVGADRIFLGVHHFSDVIGGYLLGGVVVIGSLLIFDPTPRSIGLLNDPLPEALPVGERRVAAILNPVKVDDPPAFRAMVEQMAAESGWTGVSWWETTEEDTGYRMAHEAAVSGAALVLAIGGDGTIRAVCEELAGTGIPVGIVPAGTGNLLARNLSIPLYLRAAVDVGLNGQDRAIDMVLVSGDDMDDATFLVMAGMGFDAAIMEGVNEDFKKKVGWLAYVWAALKALMFPAIKVEVSVDGGEPSSHRARTVVIGNVGNLQGGMPLLPDAAIDDGQLDVVLLYPRRFLSWLPLAARVLTKNRRTDATITRMRGRVITVRASSHAPRQLDGDLLAPGRELRAECVHGRLLVRVPR